MKKPNYIPQKTKVHFRLERDEPNTVWAYFPEIVENRNPDFPLCRCYAHVGQHSSCSPAYFEVCKKATPEQYADLKAELEGLGYDLQIVA